MYSRLKYTLLAIIISCNSLSAQELHDYRYYKLFAEPPQQESHTTELDETERGSVATYTYSRLQAPYAYTSEVDGIRIDGLSIYEARRLQLSPDSLSFINLSQSGIRAIHGQRYSSDTLRYHHTTLRAGISTRGALGNVGATTAQQLGKGWSMVADLSSRFGDDIHIQGAFTRQIGLNLAALWRPDSLSRLSIVAMLSPSHRGTHRASTSEVFRLTGNNLYNPAWGYDGGRVRSASIRKEIIPTTLLSYYRQCTPTTNISLSAGAAIGVKRQGGIDYFNAITPQPDNYRNLPSYFDNRDVASIMESIWRNGDSRYTQINFDELRLRNSFSEESLYIMADRVERVTNLQINLMARSLLRSDLTLRYGLNAQYDASRNYKEVTDLLGGGPITDKDFYLTDNATYSKLLDNDMRNPGRKVGEGERFNYDYALRNTHLYAFADLHYRTKRVLFDVGARLGYGAVSRYGFFQKAIFADSSHGKSQRLTFAPFAIHAAALYNINAEQQITASLNIESHNNDPDNYYLNSRYNNRVAENPTAQYLYAFEMGYHLRKKSLSLDATLFARHTRGETEIRQLFDDITYEYCDFVCSDISTLHIGLEAEAQWRINRHWRIFGGAIIGRYAYTDNATISAYTDIGNNLIADKVSSLIKGLSIGNEPQIRVMGGGSFYKRGWRAAINAEYKSLQYVSPSFTRRTMRVLNYTASPEEYNQIMEQERLPDIINIDLTLSKTFYLRNYDRRIYRTDAAPRFTDRYLRSRITISLHVDNLLGSRNNIRYAYESSRTPRRYLADGYTIRPHATLYRYDYPRTFYLQLRFAF